MKDINCQYKDSLGNPVDITGIKILAQFRLDSDCPVAFQYSSDQNTIQMVDSTIGKYKLVGRIINHTPGVYTCDIEFIPPDGKIFTPVTELILPIVNDYSRDANGN